MASPLAKDCSVRLRVLAASGERITTSPGVSNIAGRHRDAAASFAIHAEAAPLVCLTRRMVERTEMSAVVFRCAGCDREIAETEEVAALRRDDGNRRAVEDPGLTRAYAHTTHEREAHGRGWSIIDRGVLSYLESRRNAAR